MPAPTATGNFNPFDAAQLSVLVGRESELNWEPRDRLIDALTLYCTETQGTLQYATIGSFGSLADLRQSTGSLTGHSNNNNANDPRNLLASLLKINYEDILQILHTPRTQLSIRTCNFIPAFASFLGPALFDQFAENSLNHLLKLSGTTKKIIASAATASAKTISALMLPQRAIPVLLASGGEKNASVRKSALECLKVLVDRSMQGVGDDGSLQRLWEGVAEKLFVKALGDANAEIRTISVSIFCQFKERLASAQQFIEKLDPSTKKQLSLALAKHSNANAITSSKPPAASSTPNAPTSSLKSFIAQKQNSSRQSTPGQDGQDEKEKEKEKEIASSGSSRPSSPTKRAPFSTSPLRSHSAEQISTLSPTKHRLFTKSPSQLFRSSSFESLVESKTEPEVKDEVMQDAEPLTNNVPVHVPIASTTSTQLPITSTASITSQVPVHLPTNSNTPMTPHRKSPIKHAKSADSFLSSGQNSPSFHAKRQTLQPEAVLSTGSPMKVDSVGNESVYMDAIEASSSSDDEIILNVKNIVKLFNSKSMQNSPKYRETLPEASSLSHFSSLLPSSQDTLLSKADNDLNCPEVDELTMELPKKIFFHRSFEDAQSQTQVPGTPPAQRALNLGLAASTPLRKLYRATSEPTESSFNVNNNNTAIDKLLNDLCAEFCHSADPGCLSKITSISSKADQLASISDELVNGVLQTALKSGAIEQGCEFISILMQKQAHVALKHSCSPAIELFELGNAAELATKLASSALNPLMSAAVVQLCCQRVSEFRLQVLAQCIQCAVTDIQPLLQASLPPLLLSLNHPNAQMRRLAVSCFQAAASKIGNESVLEAVSGSGIGDVPKRILSSFLAQR